MGGRRGQSKKSLSEKTEVVKKGGGGAGVSVFLLKVKKTVFLCLPLKSEFGFCSQTSQILQMIESGRVQQQRRTMRATMVSMEGRVTAKNLFVISEVPPFSREEPPYSAFLQQL